ncbi:MAG: hypothetical protein CR217_00195 [Beijerinckiaceae bacterium]|nr:MAG: hypothetical protein CR217_00195 [Beijerinckiaceae bacterium]
MPVKPVGHISTAHAHPREAKPLKPPLVPGNWQRMISKETNWGVAGGVALTKATLGSSESSSASQQNQRRPD